MHKVLITSPWFTERHLQRLEERFSVTTNTLKRWFSENELIDIIDQYDAVIAGLDPFTEKVIERASKLRIITRRGIGCDNIELEACKRKGIIVTNTPIPEEHQAVAEFATALILDITKHVTRSSASLKGGSWERASYVGRNINGLTVGIVGLGNIGKRVARLISALGANVIYCDPYVYSSEFKKTDLLELFSSADVVSLHVPLTHETQHFITSEVLDRLKPGSYFVNTSRAAVVIHDDLVKAVRSGRLAGVALDVFDQEPPQYDSLLSFGNVVTTPHIAAYTESFELIDNICTNNVIRTLEEKSAPEYIVIS